MRAYVIRPGYTFLGDQGAVLAGGDRIELDDDVARQHADKLDLAAVDAVAAPVRVAPDYALVPVALPASMDLE